MTMLTVAGARVATVCAVQLARGGGGRGAAVRQGDGRSTSSP